MKTHAWEIAMVETMRNGVLLLLHLLRHLQAPRTKFVHRTMGASAAKVVVTIVTTIAIVGVAILPLDA